MKPAERWKAAFGRAGLKSPASRPSRQSHGEDHEFDGFDRSLLILCSHSIHKSYFAFCLLRFRGGVRNSPENRGSGNSGKKGLTTVLDMYAVNLKSRREQMQRPGLKPKTAIQAKKEGRTTNMPQDEIASVLQEVQKAEEILARVRANPAVIERISTLARLATGRALADNNNNCICTRGASRAGQVE